MSVHIGYLPTSGHGDGHMELRHFRYFVAVAEYGGFTRAAARLHVSQPTLSQQIRDLERQVGTPLLVRDPSGTRLTPAGAAFYERIRGVLHAVDEAASTARYVAGLREGTLRVGVALPMPREIHLTVLTAFAEAYPEVQVSPRQLGLVDFDRPLIRGEIDVALMFMPVDPERLAWEPVLHEPRGLAVSTGHDLWDVDAVHFTDVLGQAFAPVHAEVPVRAVRWWTMDEQRNDEPPRYRGAPGATPEEVLLSVRLNRVVCPAPYNYRDTALPTGLRMIELTGLPPATVVAARRREDRGGLAEAFCSLAARTVRGLARSAPGKVPASSDLGDLRA